MVFGKSPDHAEPLESYSNHEFEPQNYRDIVIT
jgi:hypothetical protein